MERKQRFEPEVLPSDGEGDPLQEGPLYGYGTKRRAREQDLKACERSVLLAAISALGWTAYVRKKETEFKKRILEKVMNECGGNASSAARILKMDRPNFHRMLRIYKVQR